MQADSVHRSERFARAVTRSAMKAVAAEVVVWSLLVWPVNFVAAPGRVPQARRWQVFHSS